MTDQTMTFPCKCELCGFMIDDEDDRIFWHGYGNCVDIPPELMPGFIGKVEQP